MNIGNTKHNDQMVHNKFPCAYQISTSTRLLCVERHTASKTTIDNSSSSLSPGDSNNSPSSRGGDGGATTTSEFQLSFLVDDYDYFENIHNIIGSKGCDKSNTF